MELGITEKVALVAAASRGIGYACAEALAREGASVVMFSRDATRIEAAAETIREETGAAVLALAGDVRDPEDVGRVLGAAQAWKGRVDILVTNAGGPPPIPFQEATDAHWQDTVDLLLLSAVRLIRGVLPGMRARGWGRVVAITSISCRQPAEVLLLSNAVRIGVHGLLKTLTAHHAKEGVTFNAVMPGHTWTERAREIAGARARATGKTLEEVIEAMHDRSPTGRAGRAEEVAAAVAFLASEPAAFINGTSLLVDGGESRGLF
ncbi:MAG: SDR family oxidoreductase [Pseudomonadota bacterium]